MLSSSTLLNSSSFLSNRIREPLMKQCQTGEGHAWVVKKGCGVLTLSMKGDGGREDGGPRVSLSSSSWL